MKMEKEGCAFFTFTKSSKMGAESKRQTCSAWDAAQLSCTSNRRSLFPRKKVILHYYNNNFAIFLEYLKINFHLLNNNYIYIFLVRFGKCNMIEILIKRSI